MGANKKAKIKITHADNVIGIIAWVFKRLPVPTLDVNLDKAIFGFALGIDWIPHKSFGNDLLGPWYCSDTTHLYRVRFTCD